MREVQEWILVECSPKIMVTGAIMHNRAENL
jgi:hypothetical protein